MSEGDALQTINRDLQKKVSELEADNLKYRDRIRAGKKDLETLEARVKEMETKVPAEGSAVLQPAEAAAYEQLKALGKPEDVASRLKQAEADQARIAAWEREKKTDRAAQAGRLRPSLLRILAEKDALDLEVEGEGDEAKVFAVKGQERKPLSDYAREAWGEDVWRDLSGATVEQPKTDGAAWVRQESGSRSRSGSAVEDALARQRREGDVLVV